MKTRLIDLVTREDCERLNTTMEDIVKDICPDSVNPDWESLEHKDCDLTDNPPCNKCWNTDVSDFLLKESYKSMYHKARSIAEEAHKGQMDKSGERYILHPEWISFHLESYKDKIVAILHDAIEDTDVTIEYLKENGVDDEELLNDLLLVTHDDNDSYKEYIEKIYNSGSERAKSVKLLDLKHNMQIDRLNKLREKDIDRITKYATAYAYLKIGKWLKEM